MLITNSPFMKAVLVSFSGERNIAPTVKKVWSDFDKSFQYFWFMYLVLSLGIDYTYKLY